MHRSSVNVIVVGILVGSVIAGCEKHGATGAPMGSAAAVVSATAGSATPSSECSKVVGDAVDRVMRAPRSPEVAFLAPLQNAMTQACSEDKWPVDVLRCFGSAAAVAALDACEDRLSVDQRQHLDKLVDRWRKFFADANAMSAPKNATSVPKTSPVCERYAKLEIQCGNATDSDRPTILLFCEKARAGSGDTTLQWIALESTCAETAADCGAYTQCIDAKKHAKPK